VENKKNIDELFKDGLLEPDIPFNEQDWEKMSRKLDIQSSRRRMPVWLMWGSAAAAILIISLFWIFFQAGVTGKKQPQSQIAKQKQSGAGKNTPDQDVKAKVETDNANNKQSKAGTQNNKKTFEAPAYAQNAAKGDTVIQQPLEAISTGQIALNAQPSAATAVQIPLDTTIITTLPMTTAPNDSYAAVVKDVKKKMKTDSRRKPGLTLSAMIAPDISYAESSLASKVSSNAGLLATYGFSPKLSLTTGAIYSNKFYNSNVSGVNPYNASGAEYQVNASCNVLDIPLNVNYKFVDKKNYAVSVNTGLSSYLMLKEKYNYIYPQAGSAANVISYQVSNQNKHIMGVANVAISVERKITPNLSIGVQPFMKLPLTGIGVGDANLRSSGVSFSVNMGLFPAKKPGKFAGLRHY
jgi:hypothetical protein